MELSVAQNDMSSNNFLIFFFVSAMSMAALRQVEAHGMMMDPVGRSSAWRKGFDVPANYNDNENFCGGVGSQHNENAGKCGVCRDNYAMDRPRPNENGGKYGSGTIVKTYKAGQKFAAIIQIDANHLGYFKFSLCRLSDAGDELETEDCFAEHPVKLADGSSRWYLKAGMSGDLSIDLALPANLTCEHCVLRWHWQAQNNWGTCPNGRGGKGCGPQENYRSCSDITIE